MRPPALSLPRGPAFACWLAALALALPVSAGKEIRVVADGRELPVAEASTVEEALRAAGVSLGPDDQVAPGLEALLADGAAVRVQRVSYRDGTLEVRLPFRTVVRPATPAVRPYHPTVTAEGRDGLKRVTYRARLVEGVEVERITLREEVLREPLHQVVTSRRPALLGSRGAYTGRRTLVVVATAYDPGPRSCGKFADGKTCNGRRAGYGIIAVDPHVIPLGTKLFAPGYGYGIAADVGRAIRGHRIDLGCNSRSGALAWGRRRITLQLLD